MDPDQIAVIRKLMDHLHAALAIADDLSLSLVGALLSECIDRAGHATDGL